MNPAFLFPGQGSQRPGMLHDLVHDSATRGVTEEMSRVLGFDVRSLDSAAAFQSTVSVQLALLASGVATARMLLDNGVRPSVVAGLSVGAFAAAVVAEALSLEDATRLIQSRAVQMERLYPGGYGMAAIVGLREADVLRILEEVNDERNPVFLGNINSPSQIVVSGSIGAMEMVLERSKVQGARKAEMLHVSVPSHCPLMQPVADLLLRELQMLEVRDPQFVYLSNVKARAIRSAAGVKDDLANNIAHGVRWHDTTVVAQQLGCDLFLEMPPGSVLTDLVREILPEMEAHAVSHDNLGWIVRRTHGR
jgi:malonate decarboxylase epsilon subunit